MGDGIDSYTQASNMRSQAMTTRTNAILAKRQAYADAYKLENDSAAALGVAGDSMMTMRRNQTAQMGERRVASGASGFAASSGSNLAAESSVAEVLEMAIANAARDVETGDSNARRQAIELRSQGEQQYRLGMIQAEYENKLAKIANSVAPWLMVGSGLTTIGGLGMDLSGMFAASANSKGTTAKKGK